MNQEVQVVHVIGRNLRPEYLEQINEARRNEFGLDSIPINPQPDNENWLKMYLLAQRGDELVGFARFHRVEVKFRDRVYPVLGMATMVTLERGKGYGRLLTSAMIEYVQRSGQTGLGFCNRELTPFYRKNGMGIMRGGKKRFVPVDPRFPRGDAVYVPDSGGLIEQMLDAYSWETARMSRPQW